MDMTQIDNNGPASTGWLERIEASAARATPSAGDGHTEACDATCYGGWQHAGQHLTF